MKLYYDNQKVLLTNTLSIVYQSGKIMISGLKPLVDVLDLRKTGEQNLAERSANSLFREEHAFLPQFQKNKD